MTQALASQSPAKQSSTTVTTVDGAEALTEQAKGFLLARGIDLDMAIQMGLHSSEKGRGGNWLAIPYFKGGEVVNTKYRFLGDKKFQQTEGGEQCLYNHDNMALKMPLLITEGEFDCIIALQCGFNAVSVPGGGGATYDWLEIPKAHREIIICSDADATGRELTSTLLDLLGRPRCKVARYHKGCKDLNDVFLAHGAEGVKKCIEAAKWTNASGVYDFSELPPVPAPKKYSLAMPLLPCFIREGEFSVITGFPGVGKSTILNLLARDVAEKNNIKVCFASFEQPPAIQFPRLVQAFNRGNKNLEDASRTKVNDLIKVITPPEFAGKESGKGEVFDVPWLLTQMATTVIRKGVKWIIVDPWNELEHSFPRHMTQTQYVGAAIRQFKAFAREYGIHVSIVAHPSKPPYELRGNKPSLHNISDSQHWYNKPDLGIIFARHKLEDGRQINEIEIAKSRYEDEIGALGRQFYEINFHSQQLVPASEDDVAVLSEAKKGRF